MANLSQIKRQRMLEFLNTIREEHKDDESVLIAINEIENELTRKKYGLVWEEHEEAVDVKMRTHIPVFTEDTSKEITCDTGGICNFILEGDNLHSLRLLEKTLSNSVNGILIDPPYNTGTHDFVYDDSYVGRDDAFYHSKWISFMYHRLLLAKKLLTKTGLLFIHINDIEMANLRLLCNEIFGETNFVGSFIWKNRKALDSRNKTKFSNNHEYVIVYARDMEFATLVGKEASKEKYSNPDNDPRGIWLSCSILGLANAKQRPNLHYDLIDPDTGIVYPPNPNTGWRYSRETIAQKIKEGRILFPDKPTGRPREKKFYNEIMSKYTGVSSVLPEDVGYTEDSSKEINDIFGKRAFDFPKPVSLMKFLIAQIPDRNAIILDFFAGSGTTAQAVLEQNTKDGGNRKFILCTNNENYICENVTYPRIKTVITGIRPDGSRYSDGIPANLKYYRTDFVPKSVYEMQDNLLSHIREMVQLEHGINLDNRQYVIIMSDDEADELEENWSEYPDLKGIYMSSDVLLTAAQQSLFEGIELNIIPEYYFEEELREVGHAL